MTLIVLLLALHAVAGAVWVGGMFFAYLALRPAAAALPPPQRLALLAAAFDKFFPWVWLALLVLLGSGYWMLFRYYGGMAQASLHIHVMHALGLLMTLLFLYLYFAPFRRLRLAVAAADWALAGRQAAQIRILVAVNLTLGLALIAIASSGRYW